MSTEACQGADYVLFCFHVCNRTEQAEYDIIGTAEIEIDHIPMINDAVYRFAFGDFDELRFEIKPVDPITVLARQYLGMSAASTSNIKQVFGRRHSRFDIFVDQSALFGIVLELTVYQIIITRRA